MRPAVVARVIMSRMNQKLLLIACLVLVACTRSTDIPVPVQVAANPTATDIWVAELLESGRGLRVGTPVNITDRDGYDNQPHFLPDGSGFLYTSIGSSGQADIHHFDLRRNRDRRLTRTAEGEYSPTPLAGGGFAVVRVEMDGRQRLWAFDDRGENPRLLLEAIEPVGYMAWVDEYRVGLFILGEPHTLVVGDTRTGQKTELLRSVGRSLHPVPGRARLSAVHKVSEDEWNIVEFDPLGGDPIVLAPALSPAEDFAWTPDGSLLMARGSQLFLRRPGEMQEWVEIADLAEFGLSQMTRIAVSPAGDRIALVGQR